MISKQRLLLFTGTGALMCALLFGIFVATFASTRDRLIVTMFDVGQGDAILIRTPYQQNIVIDGGPDGRISEKLSGRLPFFDRTLDLVVLTHPHADHVTGLVDLLDRYRVRKIVIGPASHTTAEYRTFLETVFSHRIPLETVGGGDVFRFGSDCALAILAPGDMPIATSRTTGEREQEREQDLNDSSIVATLTFNTNEFLLMGDAGRRIEQELLARGAIDDIDVLKVGHHGSKGASTDEFLAVARPEIAIISSGRGNSYGHPHRAALERLKAARAAIWRTDEQGDVELVSDGRIISIHSQK